MVTNGVKIKNTGSQQNQLARLGLIALVGGATAIGFAPILVRLSQTGPTATAFWRMTLALPVLWTWMMLSERNQTAPRGPTTKADYYRLVAAGLFFAGDLGIWHWSVNFTSVANATLLVNFMPVFVTLAGWLLFRQRVTLTFILGMTTALVGATMLIGASFSLNWQHILGDLLGLTAAIFYAGYILSVKDLRGKFSVMTIMAWAGIMTCLALLPVTLLSGEKVLPFSLSGWVVLAGLALFSHVGGQGLIAYGLAHLPAAFSSVTLLIQPVVAAIFAWLILSEALGPWQILGGIIVLSGIFVARRGSKEG